MHYIECIIPILDVSNLQSSIRFYEEKLGFNKEWESQQEGYHAAGLVRDKVPLYLSEVAAPARSSVWVGVENVDGLHEEWVTRGVPIALAPTRFPWGREMRVGDPDGHTLRICGDA